MQSIIQQIDGWANLTAAEIRTALLESVETRLAARATLIDTAWATGARGLRDFGVDAWSAMRAKLVELGMSAVVDQLSYGMDFGDPQTQAMCDQLAQLAPDVFTAERVAILKAWGVTRETRWANLGGEGDVPSEAEIAAAVATIGVRAWFTAKTAVVEEGLFDGSITTAAQVRAVLEAD